MNEYEKEAAETQLSEDSFQNPVSEQYQTEEEQQKWLDEISASRKERETFNKRGIATIKRYADEREGLNQNASNFNVFFANTEIKASSLYARTPKPDIKRRFNDANDDVSRVAGNVLQRNIVFELEREGFDPKLKQMLFDRLVPGIGIGWARLDQEEGEHDFDEFGQPVPDSNIKSQLATIDYVAWDDFFWAPCKVWTTCRWVARRVPMTKEAIAARFGETASTAVLAEISFSLPSDKSTSSKDSIGPKHSTQATVDVLEIWDKSRGLVFWITESTSLPLDVQQDTNEFPDFFPTPLPPMCRTTTSSTTPISDFSLVQDLYNELDALNNRCSKLVRALQLKFVYDSSNDGLKNLYTNATELEGIGIKDWAVTMGEKGGLRGSIEFAPLDEIAATYQKLVQARDMVKQQIYEIEGISDFLRGVQQPYVTAAASAATSSASSTRLSVMQMEVADYIQRLLRLKAHLICKFYTPESILTRVGSLSQADAQFVPQALQLLKDEQMSLFRLEVSVDSIQQMNWNQDKADKNELAHSITALLSQILPAVQQAPEMLPIGIELMKFMVSGYKGAKEFEGTLDAGMQQLLEARSQAQQTPPKPSAEESKMQNQMQLIASNERIAQSTNETNRMIAEMQGQLKAQDLQIKALEASTKAKEVDARIENDRSHTQIDFVSAAHKNAIDRSKLGAF